ncbi:glycoside hydrolase family 43 protein [Cohnella yongneupensis]|uniref:Glycoside hydrolase family 43 protein n=1 Tax=Cohnella yongneupensis TaxID=425006 RepID=A0ABW0QXF1_9BACL
MNSGSLPSLRTLTERVYANPLPIDYEEDDSAGTVVPRTHPDPYVLAFKGEYYGYSTAHDGVTVLHSRDLTKWTSRGYALMSPEKSYWAPCVLYHNGLFYMYYSSGDTAEHFQFMKVAVSDSPLGPFDYRRTLFDYFSIDAHVVKDDDGSFYLIYSVDNYAGTDPDRPATIILMDRLLAPFTPEGKPRLIVGASIPEEVSYPNRFGDGRDWHTLEGGFYLKREGRHYVMYSGNGFEHENYFIGTAMDASANSIGECEFVKYPSPWEYAPLLRKNDKVEGPGHHSVVLAPNLVDHWVMYHGREVSDAPKREERRQLRMDPLLWAGERMWIPGPTWEAQDAPGLPAFRELCDRPEGSPPDPARWEVVSGDWLIRDGEMANNNKQVLGHVRQWPIWQDYRFESWIRCHREMSGCCCGVLIESHVSDASLRIVVDAGRKELAIIRIQGNLESEAVRVGLSSDFDPYAWHQLSVDKFGTALSVSLDGSLQYGGVLAFDACKLGLVTQHSSAAFGGIAVTAHYETRFRSIAELNGRFQANGPVSIGKEGADIRTGNASALSLSYLPECSASYTAQWDWTLNHQAAGGQAGIRWEAVDGTIKELLVETEADLGTRVVLRDAEAGDVLASTVLTRSARRLSVSFYLRTTPRGSEIRVDGAKFHVSDASAFLSGRMTFVARASDVRLVAFRLTENV